jgi:hypothetical protein
MEWRRRRTALIRLAIFLGGVLENLGVGHILCHKNTSPQTTRCHVMRLLLLALLLALPAAALGAGAAAEDEEAAPVDCKGMKGKALRQWLVARGLKCDGCAEKSDFVALCEANKDAPVVASRDPPLNIRTPGESGSTDSVEDLLKSMKGVPGMENIKMFTADDLKNMGSEGMANAFAGGSGAPETRPRTRAEWKQDVVDFYERFALPYTDEGVETALDKWKGREQRMLGALHKKYAQEVDAFYERKDASSEEGQKEEL